MKTIIIYVSFHHQNTEKIARIIAQVLGAKLVRPSEVNLNEILDYDLIGFGSGVYFRQYHHQLFDLVEKLPMVKNKRAFIFSTSGWAETPIFNSFSKNFKKVLQEKGFKIIGQFKCRGWDTFGLLKSIGGIYHNHPNEKDLQRARDFARKLIGQESRISNIV